MIEQAWSIKDLLYGIKHPKIIFVLVYFLAGPTEKCPTGVASVCLQENHNSCDPESKSKIPGYHCSKVKLTNPRAKAALRKFILDSKVYKLAKDYYQAINHVFHSYYIRERGKRLLKVGGVICNNYW